MIVSFIISSVREIGNDIRQELLHYEEYPVLMHYVRKGLLGEKIVFDYEEEHLIGYSFPGPEVLAKADLSEFKFGYREKYIWQTAEDVLTGKFELSVLQTAVAKGASNVKIYKLIIRLRKMGKEMLKKLHGVEKR